LGDSTGQEHSYYLEVQAAEKLVEKGIELFGSYLEPMEFLDELQSASNFERLKNQWRNAFFNHNNAIVT
jgi:hypothetical protein